MIVGAAFIGVPWSFLGRMHGEVSRRHGTGVLYRPGISGGPFRDSALAGMGDRLAGGLCCWYLARSFAAWTASEEEGQRLGRCLVRLRIAGPGGAGVARQRDVVPNW